MSTLLINPNDETVKEKARFEMFPTPGGLQPGNPYRQGNEFGKAGARYPMMLYKAQQAANGKWTTSVEAPRFFGYRDQQEWDRAVQAAHAFNTGCQMTVNSAAEHERARDEGWRDSHDEAIKYREALEKAVSDAAANRAWHDKRMSPKAQAEAAAAEAEHFGHLGEIPRKPVRARAQAATTKGKRAKKAADHPPAA